MNHGIIAWLDLEVRLLRASSPMEAAFVAVNEAHSITPYRQSVLWSARQGLQAMSGMAMVDEKTPYALWLKQLLQHWHGQQRQAGAVMVADAPPSLQEQWAEWLPHHVLYLPMGEEVLLYAREEEFGEGECLLLGRVAELAGLARRALKPSFSLGQSLGRLNRRKTLIVGGLGLALCFLPVTGSVLAPADAVPSHPLVVRAPLDGVVDRVAVAPNQAVAAGEVLFQLDATSLTGRLDVARQQYATAEAEYRQAAQAMVFDPKAKAQVAILASKAEEKASEVKWLESQLERISVKAPVAGLAVFDDPGEWQGKPVAVGEKVMLLANERDSEVEAWVAASDVGDVRVGSRLTLFLNTQPLSPVRATVRSVSYDALARPDGSLAHRVRASLAETEDKPRLGLKGTARIDGERVPLIWWLFRRPLTTIRQTIGF